MLIFISAPHFLKLAVLGLLLIQFSVCLLLLLWLYSKNADIWKTNIKSANIVKFDIKAYIEIVYYILLWDINLYFLGYFHCKDCNLSLILQIQFSVVFSTYTARKSIISLELWIKISFQGSWKWNFRFLILNGLFFPPYKCVHIVIAISSLQ